ncbi:MAG: AMP-binding protein, partial [Deltaproteobacteria bacterium]|nr:AMP-binding protein [Deltaproteobacteria bacterium]
PEKVFLIWQDEEITYREFDRRANRVARGLAALGLGRGDRVALVMPNCPEFLYTLFALTKLGAIFVPVNTALTPPEAQYIIHHSDAVALVGAEKHRELIEKVRPDCPALRHVVMLGQASGADTLPYDVLLQGDPTPFGTAVAADDIAAIMYTSGTTAHPKGVLLHHGAYAFAPRARAEHLGLTAVDRILIVNPLFHINGQAQAAMTLLSVGGSIVLKEGFSASRFWEDVRRHDVTTVSIMRTIPLMLLSRPATPQDRGHRARVMTGGLPPHLQEQFEDRFGVTLVSVYSLTEDMTSVMNPLDRGRRKLGALGLPVGAPAHQIGVMDEHDRPAGPGVAGEIVKRSPASMKGYYKNPEATADALRGGWVHTGDFGYLDEDGFLYFLDRKKAIIRRSGENISSSEVEAVLNAHPKVAESAVIPVPDPLREQEVKACVVLNPGETPEGVPPEEIFAHCAARLAPFKVPRYLEYRTDFPRTASYKIQKQKLREEPDLTGSCVDRLAGAGRPLGPGPGQASPGS